MANIGIHTTLNWPVQDLSAVANTQNVVQNAKVILNGTLANQTLHTVPFTDYGFKRTVSITSPDNIAGTRSLIRGYVNGTIVTDNETNPNAGTRESTTAFDSIIDITITGGNATNVSYGTGTEGFVNLLNVNYATSTISSSTIQLILYAENINYSIYQTCEKNTLGVDYITLIENGTFFPIEGLQNLLGSTVFNNIPPLLCTSFLIRVNSSDDGTYFKTIYMQL